MKNAKISTTSNCCTMKGVTCDSGYVTEIDWSGLGLTGKIPLNFGDLDHLQTLDLSYNALTGPIDVIGNMKGIKSVELRKNYLSGTLPSNIGNLDYLVTFDARDNDFTGTVPDNWGGLSTTLLALFLGGNNLSGPLPLCVSKLTKLIRLDLSRNSFNGNIGSDYGNLVNMIELWLNNNNLDGYIASSLGKLANAERIDISNNLLIGSIPQEIGNLKSIQFLYLNGNRLTSAPASIGNLPKNAVIYLLPNDQMTLANIHPNALRRLPLSTLNNDQLQAVMSRKYLRKRAEVPISEIVQDINTYCPLDKFSQKDIMTGCIANINAYCAASTKSIQTCQSYYEKSFTNSVYRPLFVCAPWKRFADTNACASKLKTFLEPLDKGEVTSTFATFFTQTIFTNPTWTPCFEYQKCIWTPVTN